jgi:UDP-N-acetylglucosamine--N-acetylmuramyl-(pentapeptide) pyrophosphoryl-undecaprenol N-acetylglucosamine transferase
MGDGSRVILLAGGGSGGHLYPGIAVAEALRDSMPEARPLFLCTERAIDRTILEPTGFEFIPQPIVPPHRSIGGLLRFWRSWRQTLAIVEKTLDDRKPSAVLGLGGYAAGVAVKLAGQRGIPTAVLNPDVIPGKANNYLLKHVSALCCQFERTREHLPLGHREKVRVTGCPIRKEITQPHDRSEACRSLGLDPMLKTLLVTGASQGAVTVNEAAVQTLSTMKLNGWQVLHLAGKDHGEPVRAGYRQAGVPAVVIDFTPAMAVVWAATDLAISRAGASSVAELTACGVPSVLMPYPFHKDMHQLANAKELASVGAAVIVDDAREPRVNAERLKPALEPLLYDASARERMGAAARSLGRPDAAGAVAQLLAELIATG